MLEDEEIKNLLHKAQAGDQIAKEYILENNINLVRSVVHRFTNRGYEWDDLFQLGCIVWSRQLNVLTLNLVLSFQLMQCQ